MGVEHRSLVAAGRAAVAPWRPRSDRGRPDMPTPNRPARTRSIASLNRPAARSAAACAALHHPASSGGSRPACSLNTIESNDGLVGQDPISPRGRMIDGRDRQDKSTRNIGAGATVGEPVVADAAADCGPPLLQADQCDGRVQPKGLRLRCPASAIGKFQCCFGALCRRRKTSVDHVEQGQVTVHAEFGQSDAQFAAPRLQPRADSLPPVRGGRPRVGQPQGCSLRSPDGARPSGTAAPSGTVQHVQLPGWRRFRCRPGSRSESAQFAGCRSGIRQPCDPWPPHRRSAWLRRRTRDASTGSRAAGSDRPRQPAGSGLSGSGRPSSSPVPVRLPGLVRSQSTPAATRSWRAGDRRGPSPALGRHAEWPGRPHRGLRTSGRLVGEDP